MSKKISISQTVFDKLSKHMEDFSAMQEKVLNDIDLVPAAERNSHREIFNQYGQYLQHLLRETRVSNSADESLPCVILDSVVELEDLENLRTSKVYIAFPGFHPTFGAKSRIAKTSYNSPVGRALFLKKPGETVEVQAPGGIYRYRIKTVAWMN